MATWLRSGSVDVTNGAATINFTGVDLIASGVQTGDAFHAPDGKVYEIDKINTATQAALAQTYLGATAVTQAYAIQPTRGVAKQLTDEVRTLISQVEAQVDGILSGRFADGTAGTPSFTNTGDTDTGLFFPAADTLAASTGGVERWRVTSGGLYGFGTTSPAYKFVISEAGAHGIEIAPNVSGLGYNLTQHYNRSAAVYVDSDNRAAQHIFKIGTTERFRVDATGNIGVGTSGPISKLHVSAASTASVPAAGADATHLLVGEAGNYGTMMGTLTNGSGYIQQQRYDGSLSLYSLLLNPHGGSVGIGTNTPALNLHISNTSSPGIRLDKGGVEEYTVYAGYIAGNIYHENFDRAAGAYIPTISRASSHQWRNGNGTEAMRIDTLGRLLISTTNTGPALYGATTAISGMAIDHTSYISAARDGTMMVLNRPTTSGPVIDLHQAGARRGYIASYVDKIEIAAVTHLALLSGGVERARITNVGDLCVGTTSAGTLYAGTHADDGMVMSGANYIAAQRGNGGCVYLTKPSGYTNSVLAYFYVAGSGVGSITTTGTATAYNTTSDERLKNNIAPTSHDSGAIIDATEIVEFDWKRNGSHQRFGVIAQDADKVYPEAITKGATAEDMWGADYAKYVPLMMKELQSLRARMVQLEAA